MVHYNQASDAAKALVAELNTFRPGTAACLQADLREIEALPGLVTGTVDRFGRLDALVNNASSFFATPLGKIDLAAWDNPYPYTQLISDLPHGGTGDRRRSP